MARQRCGAYPLSGFLQTAGATVPCFRRSSQPLGQTPILTLLLLAALLELGDLRLEMGAPRLRRLQLHFLRAAGDARRVESDGGRAAWRAKVVSHVWSAMGGG